MPLAPGSRLGPYEILSPLGAGGMGEVYRARDTRLDRTVAIKVLPSHLAADPTLRERFEREARAVSSLNHPHICALFDIGQHEGVDFLVMEHIEGETLASRLSRGPMPPDQAFRTAIEVADALDKAHRQGVVHRDLKPGNVMLTKSGAKLLDFGLAKLRPADPTGAVPGSSALLTQHADLTAEGSIVGTLQYMSPEQLEGKEADARTDIFSFGAVLYEMVTRRRAFEGKSQASLIAAILEREPASISSLQPMSPPALERIVEQCLRKDPDERWQSAHDVGLQLSSMREAEPRLQASSPALARWTPWALVAIVVIVALAAWLRPDATPHPAPAPIRFLLSPPTGRQFFNPVEINSMALSPDGSQIAFVASDPTDGTRVWLRPLSAVEARPLEGTEGAVSVFWSPDGQSMAFFAGDKLKRLDLRGGAPLTLCNVQEVIGHSGTWGRDGNILFASSQGEAIFRVTTAGGTPAEEIKPDSSHGETRTHWPWFLPDGRRFLYISRLRDGGGRLMLADPGTPPRQIMPVISAVQIVGPGYLVFAQDGALLGHRFDLTNGRIVGEAFSIADRVRYFLPTARASFTTSRNGVLVYQPGSDLGRVVWVDRSGRELGTVASQAEYRTVRISSDGRKALIDRAQPRTGTFDIWSLDLARGVETRLTSDLGSATEAVWLPGGEAIVFSASGGAPPRLIRKDLMTGAQEELLPVRRRQVAQHVSPDAKTLAFIERSGSGNYDIWTLPLSRGSMPSLLVGTSFDEDELRFSPDGRFIAFVSDESGRKEIYVAPYLSPGGRTRVSTRGARCPRWGRDGRELFYLSDDRYLVAVPVRSASSLELGEPVPLFALNEGKAWTDFDVPADGRRFLAIIPEVLADKQPLTVVLNWTTEIAR
ncbi:MAG TPA: protein kinase [Candidatus Polarisedimenticolia bacterium]